MPNRRTVIHAGAANGLRCLGLERARPGHGTETGGRTAATAPKSLPELPAHCGPQHAHAVFHFNVYDATLVGYAQASSASRLRAIGRLRLQLSYLRDLDGQAIAQRSLAEMQRGSPA